MSSCDETSRSSRTKDRVEYLSRKDMQAYRKRYLDFMYFTYTHMVWKFFPSKILGSKSVHNRRKKDCKTLLLRELRNASGIQEENLSSEKITQRKQILVLDTDMLRNLLRRRMLQHFFATDYVRDIYVGNMVLSIY